jgi:hypothetical protein
VLVSAIRISLADFSAAGQRRLTLPEAEQLARAAVPETSKRPPRLYLEPPALPPKNGARFNVWAADHLRSGSRTLTISGSQMPKPVDLHSAQLIKVDAGQQGTSYRYTIMSGSCGYVGASCVGFPSTGRGPNRLPVAK